jgi:hypothetical protein
MFKIKQKTQLNIINEFFLVILLMNHHQMKRQHRINHQNSIKILNKIVQ